MHYRSDAKKQHSSGCSLEPDQAKPLPVKPPHSIGTTAASQATTDKTNRKTHNKETRNKQKGKTMQKTTLAAVATAAALILIVGIAITGQTRWIVPLGVVLLAAASAFLIALPRTTSETPRKRDERGITLQTLIVTAVLVLMAGAAGVVIIAITNNANDNLENQNAGIESRCEKWEIFDPSLDAAGRGGDNGGIDSSAIGCVRVCYIESPTDAATPAAAPSTSPVNTGAKIVDKDNKDSEGAEISVNANRWKLKFSRSDITNSGSATAPKARRVEIITNDRTAGAATALVGDNHRIEVATNQRYCRVWDDSTDKEVASLRSK